MGKGMLGVHLEVAIVSNLLALLLVVEVVSDEVLNAVFVVIDEMLAVSE